MHWRVLGSCLYVAAVVAPAVFGAQLHLRTLVPPGGRNLVPLAACAVGPASLVVATRTDAALWVVDLASQRARPLKPRLAPSGLAAAGPDSFWTITEDGVALARLTLDGTVIQRQVLRERAADVVVAGNELVVARLAMAPGGLLLWRGAPETLRPWALPVEASATNPVSLALGNSVAVSSDGQKTAVVWPLLRSELALFDRQGRLRVTTPLPYFGATWAPLGFDPELLGRGDLASVPKPYAAVAIARGRVWCLSGQEGPWQAGQTRRGRHVVELDPLGKVIRIHELEVDGCRLVADGRGRLLVVDRELGVHVFDDGRGSE